MVKIGITGHRGLSAELVSRVAGELRDVLSRVPPAELVGVTCLADGADTIFARNVLALGGSLEVIIPAVSYRAELPESHHADYDDLLGRASHVETLAYPAVTPAAYMAAGELMLASVGKLVAIWDGQPSRGYGGTADVVDAAERRGIPVRVIWPEGAVRP